ncbi:Acetoin:2,6-dichlorophenolindophenol oxidoreductase subunit alpha [Aquicella siphonis]|uniref:Acetoin:2,6-dichlorophenolindophenol oxidoreductase subunit alpha n=1 Tax=Aquicella siphonis TaxID=254247 RepID=A0A5E4PHV5_9COXI|nr:thiamine pyrophosphate-dependent dehydrogenase E1 component subunit alpha [Aquicella siphonis]VVC76494.1 Acetoin:2,6-dichlorophenolindophenol oxidoreductase subunit alpha [Aquicella siphonis]
MHTPELVARLYKKMSLIRRFELRLAEIYHTDAIKSPVHLSVGQESIAVGICDPLEKNDIVSNTYRCHATYIAKGGDLNEMMAELYGKSTGCAGGKAGSMHLVDMKNGVLGASAVVGTTIPVATGYALAMQMEAEKTGHQRMTVSVFGDGGTEEGCFYESINFAALRKLPIIYVCENNRLAIHTPIEKRWATEKLCERVATYGIETHKLDHADVFTVRDTIARAAAKIRAHRCGPIFIECSTYRWLEHVGPRDDHEDNYRDLDEYRRWKEHDQIARLAKMLDAETVARLENEITAEIRTAEEFAEKSPYPADEELYKHVYAV